MAGQFVEAWFNRNDPQFGAVSAYSPTIPFGVAANGN